MTLPERPALPDHDWACNYSFDSVVYNVAEVDAAVEARERILLARIAEADEQAAQWAGLCTRLEARIESLEAINENNLAEALRGLLTSKRIYLA